MFEKYAFNIHHKFMSMFGQEWFLDSWREIQDNLDNVVHLPFSSYMCENKALHAELQYENIKVTIYTWTSIILFISQYYMFKMNNWICCLGSFQTKDTFLFEI